MTMQERLATGRGKYTPDYPELGTAPVSYDDCTSAEFFADEREAVFRRSWLYVGRAERLQRPGAYFTRELPGVASIVVAKDLDGTIHAFHNTCAHRGNKVVWDEHPGEETSGSCRAFHCKYHGWQYGLDGRISHITNEDQFFDLDRSTIAMPAVHCDELAGFIFVNLSKDPLPLRDYFGERICEIEAFPFHLMIQRYGLATRIHGNWKLAVDSVCEWYHPAYVHGKFIHPDVSKAEKMVPPIDCYHYDLFGPHMLTSVPGPPLLPPREPGLAGPPKRDQNWVYRLFRGGLFGPDDVPEIGPRAEFLNKGGIASWGNDQFWLLPNLSVQIWARNFYITYTYLPVAVDEHIYEIDLYFVPPANAHERLAQELVVDSVAEFAMQDVNTIEATHRSLATGAVNQFNLGDQELLIRSFHRYIRDAVRAYRAERDLKVSP